MILGGVIDHVKTNFVSINASKETKEVLKQEDSSNQTYLILLLIILQPKTLT